MGNKMKNKNTTLSEQFQNIVEKEYKLLPLTDLYISAHLTGMIQLYGLMVKILKSLII